MSLKVSATSFVPRFNVSAASFTPSAAPQVEDELKAAVAAAFAALSQKPSDSISNNTNTNSAFPAPTATVAKNEESEGEDNVSSSDEAAASASSSSNHQDSFASSTSTPLKAMVNSCAAITFASSSSSSNNNSNNNETSAAPASSVAPAVSSWAARIQRASAAPFQPSSSSSSSTSAYGNFASSKASSAAPAASSSGWRRGGGEESSSSSRRNGGEGREGSRRGGGDRDSRRRGEESAATTSSSRRGGRREGGGGGGGGGGERDHDRRHHHHHDKPRRGVPVEKKLGPAIKYAKEFMLSLRDEYRAKPACLEALDEDIDPSVPEALIHERAKAKAYAAAEKGERRKAARVAKNSQPIRDKHGHVIDIKPLEHQENRWIPMAKLSDSESLLYKSARGILNKLTPEKFAKLLSQFLELDIASANLARGIVTVLFDKACMEHGFGGLYAEFCNKLGAGMKTFSDEAAAAAVANEEITSSDDEDDEDEDEFDSDMDSEAEEEARVARREARRQARIAEVSKVNFRDLLVTHCVYSFKNAARLSQEEQQRENSLTDEERAERETKRRLREMGAIKFIGHLFTQGVMTIAEFVPILDALEEAGFQEEGAVLADASSAEALCRLLEIVGPVMEREVPERIEKSMATVAKCVAAGGESLASRIRFMFLDMAELRAHKWVARRAQVVDPKKLNHEAAVTAAKASEKDRKVKQNERQRSERQEERRAAVRAQKAAHNSGDWVSIEGGNSASGSSRRSRRAAAAAAAFGEDDAEPSPAASSSRTFSFKREAAAAPAPAAAAAPATRYGPLIPWSDDDDEENDSQEFVEAENLEEEEEDANNNHADVSNDEEDEEEPTEESSNDEKSSRRATVGRVVDVNFSSAAMASAVESVRSATGVVTLSAEEYELYRTPKGGEDANSLDSSDGDSFGTPLSLAQTRRADSSDSARASSVDVSSDDDTTGLNTAAAVEQCARSTTSELLCSHDVKEALEYFADVHKEEFAAVVVRVVALATLEADNDKERALCSQLLRGCVSKYSSVFTSKAVLMGMAEVMMDLEDILIDIPRANEHLVTLVFGSKNDEALIKLDDLLSQAKQSGASVPHSFAVAATAAVSA